MDGEASGAWMVVYLDPLLLTEGGNVDGCTTWCENACLKQCDLRLGSRWVVC